MSEFQKIFPVSELPEGAMKLVALGDRPVLVGRANGKLFALEEMCPHRGAPLSEGKLEGARLTCPWHQACFDVTSGEPLGGPVNRALKRYPVKEEDGWVWASGDPY